MSWCCRLCCTLPCAAALCRLCPHSVPPPVPALCDAPGAPGRPTVKRGAARRRTVLQIITEENELEYLEGLRGSTTDACSQSDDSCRQQRGSSDINTDDDSAVLRRSGRKGEPRVPAAVDGPTGCTRSQTTNIDEASLHDRRHAVVWLCKPCVFRCGCRFRNDF